ncbi:hypothetical protein MMC22_004263 [Lobaria immixta]|nr:hypothetical protein [Lobaria immixta]
MSAQPASAHPNTSSPLGITPVPSPKASHKDVEDYLVIFLATEMELTYYEALEKAKCLHVDGYGLYRAILFDKYDVPGRLLYHDIQRARYGHYCSEIFGNMRHWAGRLLVLSPASALEQPSGAGEPGKPWCAPGWGSSSTELFSAGTSFVEPVESSRAIGDQSGQRTDLGGVRRRLNEAKGQNKNYDV